MKTLYRKYSFIHSLLIFCRHGHGIHDELLKYQCWLWVKRKRGRAYKAKQNCVVKLICHAGETLNRCVWTTIGLLPSPHFLKYPNPSCGPGDVTKNVLQSNTKQEHNPKHISMAMLGKRILREEMDGWAPGRGLSTEAVSEDSRAAFDRRTSLLFLELQNNVHDALRWRHARDAKARKVSHDIAKRCPLEHDVAAAMVHALTEELPATVKKVEVKVVLSFEEKMKADAAEAKARANARSLPEPLTTALLSAAYKEVPSGAEQTIERVIECWRTSKLSAQDVIATVKSFSGSSPVLRKVFSEEEQEGEVASAEQMVELARLAMCR